MYLGIKFIGQLFWLTLFSFFLIACGNSEPHDEQGHEDHKITAHINKSDECHLCGMVIQQFPGPKGQLEEKHSEQIRKFCSTNDLFSFMLQPENQHNIKSVYVHDMSNAAWDSPQDESMIEADKAWYVAGHKLQGAMGPTIASFKTETAAQNFQKKQGGYLLTFADINLELMNKLMQMPMHSHH
jgi:copper chaperone NosL